MNISSLGIFFGVLLAALPVFIIIRFRLNLTRRFLMSLVRMVVATGLLAALMTLATWAQSITLSIAISIIIGLFTALTTTVKARLKPGRDYLPIAAGGLLRSSVMMPAILSMPVRPGNSKLSILFR